MKRSTLSDQAQAPQAPGPLRALMDLLPVPRSGDGVAMVGVESRRRLSPEGQIDGLAVAVGLVNTTDRAQAYEIERIATTLDGRIGSGERTAVVSGILAPGLTIPFTSAFAAIAPLTAGRSIDGTFELVLRYGRPGGPQRTAAFHCAVSFKAGPTGEIAAFRWSPI